MAKKSPYCPLIQKGCIEHKCAWYCNIQGTNPQTGGVVDQWGCAVAAIPMLQVEQSQAARATQSATVEVREQVHNVAKVTALATGAIRQMVLPAKVEVD